MTNSDNHLVLYGEAGATTTRLVLETARALGVAVEHVQSPATLGRSLDAHQPLAVIVVVGDGTALQACLQVRARPALAHVPILGLTAERSVVAFLELYQWEGDDLVEPSLPALVRRLWTLLSRPAPAPLRDAPRAVVAGGDPPWRNGVARALFNAGLDVQMAATAEELAEHAASAKFVIASHELAPEGAVSAVTAARAAGSTCPWVLVAPPKRVALTREAVAKLSRVGVVDAFSPHESALFLANELAYAGGPNHRAHERLLYGTTVAFRAAGRDVDEVGFTHNVSCGGIFLRTLASLDVGDEVWLELRPPRTERRVRLVGQVKWRRVFGRDASAVVPPGFGVIISEGLSNDLQLWRDACRALAQDETRASAPWAAPESRPRVASVVPMQLAPALV